MSFFKQVEGEAAVLVESGVYKQCDVFTRDGYLYAKVGGGFVRLMADGSTSKARCSLNFMSFAGPLASRMGRLCVEGTVGATALAPPAVQKLLGSE